MKAADAATDRVNRLDSAFEKISNESGWDGVMGIRALFTVTGMHVAAGCKNRDELEKNIDMACEVIKNTARTIFKG